ncbi:MAG: peptidoglycan DD-metalloendopeptidase family protein [Actinomycetota bacterium]|nr:peptidoglycan DD-metalloendopeptidase family protein [Actinomycetota bacterium]
MLKLSRIRSLLFALVLAVAFVATASIGAHGQEELSEIEARMEELQSELDETTQRIEDLRTEQDHVRHRIGEIELDLDRLADRRERLIGVAEDRAEVLYKRGTVGMFEALVAAEDFGELLSRAELAERVSEEGNAVFYRLARDSEELTALSAELEDRQAELAATTDELESASAELQDKFEQASDEYAELKRELARERRAAAAAAAAETDSGESDPAAAPPTPDVSGKACPVNGPNSFIDSWGAPRVGHTHVGTDIMADYGTPVVAIVSGTVSSGWSDTGGNMIFLSGEDGNSYWYLHNQENLVTSGHVSVGQQIATVGDTGNAVGIPHVHFEYHPGGGGPVNPYPLLVGIC